LTIRDDRDTTDDLDSPENSWQKEDGDGGLDGPALIGLPELAGENNTYMAVAEEQDPTYDECRIEATDSYDAISIGDLTVGTTVCLITTADRVASLRLLKDASSSRAIFAVVVWQPTR
jgi:hypothetical protein